MIRLEGIALHVVDTAGIRRLDDDLSVDTVERIGIARTWEAIGHAHVVLHLVDAAAMAGSRGGSMDGSPAASTSEAERDEDLEIARRLPSHVARRIVVNKIDLTGDEARVETELDRVVEQGPVDVDEVPRSMAIDATHEAMHESDREGRSDLRPGVDDSVDDTAHSGRNGPSVERPARVYLSAKTGAGIDLLRHELLAIAGWQPSAESGFLARERHVSALRAATAHVDAATAHAAEGDRQLDLMAEELRLAQIELDRITGVFSADALLGEIFGRFCIGK